MPTSADLLLDTSVAVPLVNPNAQGHAAVHARTRGLRLGLAGHAVFETYSVLTRLPGRSRLSAQAANRVIAVNFPASTPLPADGAAGAIEEFRDAGVAGGAVYDGLIGLAARSAGIPLLTADRRAAGTYSALSIAYELVSDAVPPPGRGS